MPMIQEGITRDQCALGLRKTGREQTCWRGAIYVEFMIGTAPFSHILT